MEAIKSLMHVHATDFRYEKEVRVERVGRLDEMAMVCVLHPLCESKSIEDMLEIRQTHRWNRMTIKLR